VSWSRWEEDSEYGEVIKIINKQEAIDWRD
jgi:hypothetical protein